MSYIGESRKAVNRPWQLVLCLEKEDCLLLLKVVQKIAIRAQKNYEKWKDIHEGGEMTTLQETTFMKAEEKLENADALCANIKAFLAQELLREEHEKQLMKGVCDAKDNVQ